MSISSVVQLQEGAFCRRWDGNKERYVLVEKAGRVAREAPARPETVEAAMSVGRLSLSAAAMNLWLRCTAGATGFVVRARGRDETPRIVVGARLTWITCSG